MKIDQYKSVTVEELKGIVPTNAGATYTQLWHIFHYTRMFKYVSYRHFMQIKKSFNKICTYEKLYRLCELGYLKSPARAVYCATNKVLPILKEAGLNTDILPDEPVGKGYVNELNNTDIFVQLTKLPHFKAIVYPNFGFLRPDGLLIQLDEENRKYKLTFLEIEAKKSNWSNYIDAKREKYLSLSRELTFYNYWKHIASKLSIPVPDIEQFKFSISFYCTLQKDYGPGFQFINSQSF
ncbi:MAG: hypothetical protein K1X86_12005 [Ignavibacteria bacterium]|nr:hypothetical protein [Ignavibacteria bacterium]